MGAVYEAIDQRVSCIVALKETHAGTEGDARIAFAREASLLANLKHQALPKVMDNFSEGEADFLVMEYIPGYDLAELLELRGSPFSQSQVLRWADDLLKVLEYLHGQQPPVLHRDIKPANLKLTKQGEIFLLDFGLAKGTLGQMPTFITSRSVRGYTPVYAPLEQIHGQGTDPRSDLYSLGATLYHLLAGIPPIDAPTRFNAIEEEQPDPLQPIVNLNPQVSPDVAEVVTRAMAVSRRQRPGTATEMRRLLRNAEEESERSAAEDEYRRAEVKRKERDSARMRVEEDAARAAAELRKRQESETRVLEEERLRDAVSMQRAAEEASQRAAEAAQRVAAQERERRPEEERLRREAEESEVRRATAEAARIRAEEEAKRRRENFNYTAPVFPRSTAPPTIRFEERPVIDEATAPRLIQTIQPPPPERIANTDPSYQSFTPVGGVVSAPSFAPAAQPRKSRAAIIIVGLGALLLVIVAAVVVVFLLLAKERQSKAVQPQSQTGSPAQLPSPGNPTTTPAGMVYIPGGTFTMGRDDGDEYARPAHHVTVKPYFIDLTEVTNEDYAKFVAANPSRRPSTWTSNTFPAGEARKPVTGVTWSAAVAYAQWKSSRDGGTYRLPTEEEWEFAARGTDGRVFPWGNDWKTGMANADGASTGMADVGSYKGASPFGVLDMIGNAWEWTASDLTVYPGGQIKNLPQNVKVIRGASFQERTVNGQTTAAYRGYLEPENPHNSKTGFRCVKEVVTR